MYFFLLRTLPRHIFFERTKFVLGCFRIRRSTVSVEIKFCSSAGSSIGQCQNVGQNVCIILYDSYYFI